MVSTDAAWERGVLRPSVRDRHASGPAPVFGREGAGVSTACLAGGAGPELSRRVAVNGRLAGDPGGKVGEGPVQRLDLDDEVIDASAECQPRPRPGREPARWRRAGRRAAVRAIS